MDKIIQALIEWLKRLRPFAVVAAWEQGVRIRFGKNVKLLNPGIHWLIPIADRVFITGIQRRMVNIPMQTVTTRDGVPVTLSGMVGFRIANLATLYLALHNVDDSVIQYSQAEIANAVAGQEVADLNLNAISKVIGPVVTSRLEACGLSDVEVTISDFVRVRTFRVIQDGKYGSYSDVLTLKSSVLPT